MKKRKKKQNTDLIFFEEFFDEQQIEQGIDETQKLITSLLSDIVYAHEPIEDFEEADLNLKIAKAMYTPIIFYKNSEKTLEEIEEIVKKQIDDAINYLREERDGQGDGQDRENNTDFEYDN